MVGIGKSFVFMEVMEAFLCIKTLLWLYQQMHWYAMDGLRRSCADSGLSRSTPTVLKIQVFSWIVRRFYIMFTTREDVEALLKKYPGWQKKITLLEFERKNPSEATHLEVLSGLAFARPLIEGAGASGHISDKTMQIALSFREKADRMNSDTILDIDQELSILRTRIEKLDFYVSQLEEKQAEVIRGHYFEGMSWVDLQKKLHISSRTLSNRRNNGLDALIAMGEYLEKVIKGPVLV